MHMGLVLPSLEVKFQASSMTSHYPLVVISMSNDNQNLNSIQRLSPFPTQAFVQTNSL